MNKKSFTLLELLVTIIMVGIIATWAIANYKLMVEDAKTRKCEGNLKTLKMALDSLAMDREMLPTTLREIPKEYVNRAYAQLLSQKDGWKYRLANFILGFDEANKAYACHDVTSGSLLDRMAVDNTPVLYCPKDGEGPCTGLTSSYGINLLLSGITYTGYQALPADTILIGDHDAVTFDTAPGAYRHRSRAGCFAIVINKQGVISRLSGTCP